MDDDALDDALVRALLEHTHEQAGDATQQSLLEACARTLERPTLTRAELEQVLVPMLAAHWLHAVAFNVRARSGPVRYYVTEVGAHELELRRRRAKA